MSSDLPDNPNKFETSAANIEHVRVEDEMEQSYIDYAMSVIAGRALPDVRDGLNGPPPHPVRDARDGCHARVGSPQVILYRG